jgi:hypothetical protein
MNANLFSWIREGVKQSVLLGVSDAVEALGVPDNADDIRPRLMEFMQQDGDGSKTRGGSGTARRKRLGRTLKDMESESGK